MVDKKKAIHSTYLALGSIASYLSISIFGNIWYPLQQKWYSIEQLTELTALLFLLLVAAILLTISYYGFLHSKKYPRFTGILGCALFVSYNIYYWMDISKVFGFSIWHMNIYLPMIAAFILMILTLIFWKKLAG